MLQLCEGERIEGLNANAGFNSGYLSYENSLFKNFKYHVEGICENNATSFVVKCFVPLCHIFPFLRDLPDGCLYSGLG